MGQEDYQAAVVLEAPDMSVLNSLRKFSAGSKAPLLSSFLILVILFPVRGAVSWDPAKGPTRSFVDGEPQDEPLLGLEQQRLSGQVHL